MGPPLLTVAALRGAEGPPATAPQSCLLITQPLVTPLALVLGLGDDCSKMRWQLTDGITLTDRRTQRGDHAMRCDTQEAATVTATSPCISPHSFTFDELRRCIL